MGSVLQSGTAQPDLPLAEVCGPAVILTSHREVPLSERRMVLYTYSAPDVSPADPCNKMPARESLAITGGVERAFIRGGPAVRIPFPPAVSLRTIGS